MYGLIPEGIGKGLCRAAAVLECRREVDLHMTVAGNGIVLRVDLIELSHALCDNADFDAIARADCKRLFDALEFPELRELIEHEEKTLLFLLFFVIRCELHIADELGEHCIDKEAQDWAQLVNVVGLEDEIERHFL